MSVAWRIVLSAALPMALLVGAAGPSLVALNEAGVRTGRELHRVAPVVRDAAAADNTLATLSRLQGRWSVQADPAFERLWASRMGDVEGHFGTLADVLETRGERKSLVKVERALDRYRRLTSTADGGQVRLRVLSADERVDALRANARARRGFLAIGRQMETTAWHAEAAAATITRETHETLRGAAVLATLLALLLSSATALRMVRGLRHLVWASEALERGRLDEPLAIRGRDELARLASGFETLAQELRGRDGVWDDTVRRLTHDLAEPLQTIHEASLVLVDELGGPSASRQARLAAFVGDLTAQLVQRVDRIGAGRAAEPHGAPPLAFDPPVLLADARATAKGVS